MCEQCLVAPVNFGEPLTGWYLARARKDGNDWKRGQWGLIQCNDPTFTWSLTPLPSPTWGMTDEEEGAWFNAVDEASFGYWRDLTLIGTSEFDAFVEAFNCDPLTGHEIVVAAMEKGYDPKTSGALAYWLFDYLGQWLETATPEPDDYEMYRHPDNVLDPTIGRDPLPTEPRWPGETNAS